MYDTLGPQVTWLKQDLAANTQQWTIVYFHHPPYTKGSHDSDTEPELINMRQNLVRILERYKVDLVLNGHSHSYERSYLINGHYGLESSFDSSTHVLSNSSGKYDGSINSCPYIKNSSEVRNGIVYAVVGSSGKLDESSPGYPHQAMHYSNVTVGGAMVIEIESNMLDAKWICSDGVMRDNFTFMKQVNNKVDTTVAPSSNISLSASWTGNYTWSTGETTRNINIAPSTNSIYTVRDNFNCLADTFNVIYEVVLSSQDPTTTTSAEDISNLERNFKKPFIYPNPFHKQFKIRFPDSYKGYFSFTIVDQTGKVYNLGKRRVQRDASDIAMDISNLSLRSGVYFLRIYSETKNEELKLIIQ